MKDASWAQVRATLIALDLASDSLEPTFAMRRILKDEANLVEVLESLYGAEIVQAVEGGDVGTVIEILPVKQSAANRFMSFVRGALRDAERPASPARSDGRRRANINSDPSPRPRPLDVATEEAAVLLRHFEEALGSGNLDAAERIQTMLHRSARYEGHAPHAPGSP